jgi:SAM-dependent methyltransferase
MSPPSSPSPAGVEFPQATWTSFDRYGRYAAIVGALRASLGPGPHRVLDVGDSAGHLHLFDPELRVVGIDVELAAEPLPETVRAQADGKRLPFADGAFDAVVSSDVLEHVPAPGRDAFLAELVRVSRDLVVVAAPFDTPGVAGVEDIVRRYARFSADAPQPQLEEHLANGLPTLDTTVAALEAAGCSVATVGNGNLWDWQLMMVLRFQLEARDGLRPLSQGYDAWYNQAVAARARIGPFYRHVVVARSGGRIPRVGTPAEALDAALESAAVATPHEALPPDMAALLAALIAADTSEATRHDALEQDRQIAELRVKVDHLTERLESLIELEVSMADQQRALLARVARLARPFRRGDQ